jgi:hypothetical protein
VPKKWKIFIKHLEVVYGTFKTFGGKKETQSIGKSDEEALATPPLIVIVQKHATTAPKLAIPRKIVHRTRYDQMQQCNLIGHKIADCPSSIPCSKCRSTAHVHG